MKRRRFLKASLFGCIGLPHIHRRHSLRAQEEARPQRTPLPQRDLGRTGERLSIIGLGGVALSGETPERVRELVRDAIAQGVNYFDVAPSYGDAEDLLGPALEPVREQVFLACKTQQRDNQGAAEELARSLQKLKTDHIDLYQFHAFTETREVEQALGRRGAIETFLQARQEGVIKYIGFSAHSAEAALLAMSLFDFDTVLFPVNYVCYFQNGFGRDVLEKAREKRMGILAIKALARQPWPDDSLRKHWPKAWYQPITDPGEANLALRFSLSLPVAAAVPPGDSRLFRRALEIAQGFVPINDREIRELKRRASQLTPLFPLGSA